MQTKIKELFQLPGTTYFPITQSINFFADNSVEQDLIIK